MIGESSLHRGDLSRLSKILIYIVNICFFGWSASQSTV